MLAGGGGVSDTGSLLAAVRAAVRRGSGVDAVSEGGGVAMIGGALSGGGSVGAVSGGGGGGGGGGNSHEKVGAERRDHSLGFDSTSSSSSFTSCAEVMLAAAVARGEARAEAEWHDGNFCGSGGGGGVVGGDGVVVGGGAGVGGVGVGDGIKGGHDKEGAEGLAYRSKESRGSERGMKEEDGEEDGEGGSAQKLGVVSRRSPCGEGEGAEDPRQALNEAKRTTIAQGGGLLEGGTERGLMPGRGGAMAGSTSMVLEWDVGCTNGAITTNYEVRGKRGVEGLIVSRQGQRLVGFLRMFPLAKKSSFESEGTRSQGRGTCCGLPKTHLPFHLREKNELLFIKT